MRSLQSGITAAMDAAAQDLYVRLEEVRDRRLRSFFEQTVCCALGDAYDFCCCLPKGRSLFRQSLFRRGQTFDAALLCRLVAVYHAVHHEADLKLDAVLTEAFVLNKKEIRGYRHFRKINRVCPAQFEASFARYACQRLFGLSGRDPRALAFSAHFLYNSTVQMEYQYDRCYLKAE